MRISDWSSDVCSSDLSPQHGDEHQAPDGPRLLSRPASSQGPSRPRPAHAHQCAHPQGQGEADRRQEEVRSEIRPGDEFPYFSAGGSFRNGAPVVQDLGFRISSWLVNRSEEHTSELQSLMRISYAVFCLKKKKTNNYNKHIQRNNTRTT